MSNPQFIIGTVVMVGPNLLSKHISDRAGGSWQGTIVRVNNNSVEVKPREGGFLRRVSKERITPAY